MNLNLRHYWSVEILAKGLTLKEIEAKVGVSATHVSEVERGKTSPTVGALSKIAAALEVNASNYTPVKAGFLPTGQDKSKRTQAESQPKRSDPAGTKPGISG